MIDFAGAVWRKSSITQGSGDACVEVASLDTVVAARDSKNPSGPKLTFDRPAWAEFTGRVKTGRFDR
jgi:hypothetical protein